MDSPEPDLPVSHSFRAPVVPEAEAWARAYAGALAAAARIDPDTADDLRLAVSELMHVIIGAATDEVRIEASFGDRLVLSVGPWPRSRDQVDDLDPWDIVSALFDDVEVRDGHVRLAIALPPP